ncbi:MAG: hypothetical protein ABIV47_04045 [Roseiflexaceae bacterium]
MPIPPRGLPAAEILRALNAYKQHDAPWRAGRVFADVYDLGFETEAVTKAAYALFLSENGLYPNYFASLL